MNIKTSASINVPDDIPIDKYDIAIILNNALNNAIEACDKVDTSWRYIKCVMFLKLNYLNLYFENSCVDNHIKGEQITTKTDKSIHGFGLKNIRSIVNKYDGFMECTLTENKYILRCSLLVISKN